MVLKRVLILNFVHGGEEVFGLDADGLVLFFRNGAHVLLDGLDGDLVRIEFDAQDHGEVSAHERLGDVNDVDIEFCKGSGHRGDDAGAIGAGDGHNGIHACNSICLPGAPRWFVRAGVRRPSARRPRRCYRGEI